MAHNGFEREVLSIITFIEENAICNGEEISRENVEIYAESWVEYNGPWESDPEALYAEVMRRFDI